MELNRSDSVRPEWFMFYHNKAKRETEHIRISGSCLGDATEIAKELASMSNLHLVGVAPELGVTEG